MPQGTGTLYSYLLIGGTMLRTYLLKQVTLIIALLQRCAQEQNVEDKLTNQALRIITSRLNEAHVILSSIITTLDD